MQPSSATAGKSGREVYDSLAAKSYVDTKKYNCTPASPDQILYICGDENKGGSDEIVFKDFAGKLGSKSTYRIRLIPTVSGTGENARSSFYISMERLDENGSVVSRQKIGSPDVVRKGVTSYKIEKILCNKRGDGIVFIVAKTMEDKTGVLIRYMAETAKLRAATDLKVSSGSTIPPQKHKVCVYQSMHASSIFRRSVNQQG